MDTENNQNSSLGMLHAYDSSDSSDESNQNISEKYVSSKASATDFCASENDKNAAQSFKENDNGSENVSLNNENITGDPNNIVVNASEDNKSNNNGEHNDGHNVDMNHREVKPWIGELSCDDDDDSDSSSSSEWESLKGDDGTSDSDDDNVNVHGGATFCNKKVAPRVRGELGMEDLPPIEDLTISMPNDQCVHIGVVYDIVDQLVIVKAIPKKPTLDLDTVLFLEEGARTLGHIFDVFGQVTEPFYCVRFNSNDHIKNKGIQRNMMVYYAPKSEFTHLVYAPDLMKVKGSDASWKDDVEVPDELCDYSDDEHERRAKQQNKDKKKKKTESQEQGETSSGNKKPKLTPYEIKMNKKNLEKTAEFNKMNNFRMLYGRGRGLVMGQPNMEIRSQSLGRARTMSFFSELQRTLPNDNLGHSHTPFDIARLDIPHGFRVFSTQCPRLPFIPGGTNRNPIPMNRPAFSPPPGQPFSRPHLHPFGRGSASNIGLVSRFPTPRPGGGNYF